MAGLEPGMVLNGGRDDGCLSTFSFVQSQEQALVVQRDGVWLGLL